MRIVEDVGIYKGAIYENMIVDILGKTGRKLSSKNVGGTEQIDSYPLYMAMFL